MGKAKTAAKKAWSALSSADTLLGLLGVSLLPVIVGVGTSIMTFVLDLPDWALVLGVMGLCTVASATLGCILGYLAHLSRKREQEQRQLQHQVDDLRQVLNDTGQDLIKARIQSLEAKSRHDCPPS